MEEGSLVTFVDLFPTTHPVLSFPSPFFYYLLNFIQVFWIREKGGKKKKKEGDHSSSLIAK